MDEKQLNNRDDPRDVGCCRDNQHDGHDETVEGPLADALRLHLKKYYNKDSIQNSSGDNASHT